MSARAIAAREATDPPPRIRVRGACVGRLLAPGLSLAFPTGLVSGFVSDRTARYSGGAAPAFNRFPCPARASFCVLAANLGR